MKLRQPVAFLSYVRADDDHDWGRITQFRNRLEGEIKMQTGRPFAIFQDRNDISWGQEWNEVIRSSLAGVTFLIPIITPSFFVSPACRSEFETFLLREKTVGTTRLILPLYYVTCEQFEDGWAGDDQIARALKTRQWTDWRPLRFLDASDAKVGSELAKLATAIKNSVKDLEAIIAEGASKKSELPDSEEHLPATADSIPEKISSPIVPEIRRAKTRFDKSAMAQVVSQHEYYAYTKQFDEVLHAQDFAEENEMLRLYRQVSTRVRRIEKVNAERIPPIVSRKAVAPKRVSCAVTLLVDNSGSLRQGKLALPLAAWCTIISQWLDASGVPNEVLGFTTRAWKGGQSRELWLSEGKPSPPGRLNDLRHIIYKSFDQDARTAAPGISVMTREGVLKENIDGEALLWAADRLELRDVERRFLFVLSDGAPVDDSTLSVNPGNYLERHLRAAIDWLSTKKTLSLVGIGIGHDVSRYYSFSYYVQDPNEFGLPILRTISETLNSTEVTN